MQEKNLTCLLIDDDPDDQEIFRFALKKVDPSLQCVFANDGVVALEKLFGQSPIDPLFIFIDINMPRLNGMQCLSEIKKREGHKYTPIYMYSTTWETDVKKQCKNIGATDFIVKSPNIHDLENVLGNIVSKLRPSAGFIGMA